MVHSHYGFRKSACAAERSVNTFTHSWMSELKVLQSQNEMRSSWCTMVLGCRNLGFVIPERNASVMVHTQSGLPKHRSRIPPGRDANPMVQTHFELAKRRFCNPRTKCEPYGAHSFWAVETQASQSQNEMRTLWCTLILGC